ncbi:PAS domain S-box protein [Ferruginibacter albus]|uniref:PAS domain S-box protein n=1 Tax=Ferruginibacter albus TaxID=2875540 RepID=UPI001CC49452|nr:PAS domain S-box protein [Ferruginibacter albus]UAY53559.1 PAS domain S-box protein [Ferruginibacter albus]
MKSGSFERTIVISMVIVLIAVFFFSIYTFILNNEIKSTNSWVSHTNRVLYRSEKVISALKDIETGTRGYILTGDSVFLQPYFSSRDSIYDDIADLKDLTKDNNFQHKKVSSLDTLTTKRLALCRNLQLLKNNNTSFDSIKPLLLQGKKVMDEIRDTFKSIQQEEERLLTIRKKNSDDVERKSQFGFFILFGSLLFLFLTAFFAIRFLSGLRKKEGKALRNLDSGILFFSKRIDEIIKGISDPFFALNKRFEFVYYNDSVIKSIGQGKGNLTRKNVFEVFPQYNQNIIGQKMKDVMATQQSESFEAFEDFLDQWQDITIYPTSQGISVHIKDATKRKTYEAELNTAKQLLETINTVALVGGWNVDIASGKVSWTDITRGIYEAAPDHVPDLRKLINFYKPGKSRETIAQFINDAIEEDKEWDAELLIVTDAGKEKWVYSKGKPEFQDGVCVRIVGTLQDIDAKKKLSEQLLKSEQQFKSAFDNSLDGMTLVGVDSQIREINQSFCDISGYSRDEFKQLGFTAFTHPDDREKDKATFEKIMSGAIKRWRYEKRYLHKNGNIIWAEASGSVITDREGNIESFVAQMQDITNKKNAEDKFLTERNLLRTIIDNLPVNIYMKDLESRKTLVNKAELLFCGAASEAEVIGKTDQEFYPNKYALQSIAEDKYVFATGKPLLNKETKAAKHDGTETTILTSKIPLFNENNEIIGLVGISYDITFKEQ